METDTKFETLDFVIATEEYESEVARRADGELPLEIDNFHIVHAAILTKHILRRTENRVDILTGSMQEFFFKKIETSLLETLERNEHKIPVRIIFVKKNSVCSALTDLAKQHSNLSIYEITDESREEVQAKVSHFCVSDNKRFRLEEIHPEKDFQKDPRIKAKASFNHPDAAKFLHESFKDLLAISDQITSKTQGEMVSASV